MQTKIIKISAPIVSLLVLAAPVFVFAQIQNPLRAGSSIPGLISTLLGYIVKIGGVVATLAFIWAGFLYVEARGNPGKLDKAKEVFINTCIGTAILLGAQLIASIITNTIGSIKG